MACWFFCEKRLEIKWKRLTKKDIANTIEIEKIVNGSCSSEHERKRLKELRKERARLDEERKVRVDEF